MILTDYLKSWEAAMAGGEIGNKPFSLLTIRDYSRRMELFLSQYDDLTFENVKAALRAIPTQQLGKYTKLLKAIICFVKYLHSENVVVDARLLVRKGVASDELETLKRKPKRDPKQITVSEFNLKKLKEACENEFETLVVVLLSNTGLRASEACSLTVGDCDLTERTLIVRKGKGGKKRLVALTASAINAIQNYLNKNSFTYPHRQLLLPAHADDFNRYDLNRLLNTIGKRANVRVHPHALRRAFVTIGHAKGAPMDHLRINCGHSDIKTTMGYCKTQEAEALDSVRNLDL